MKVQNVLHITFLGFFLHFNVIAIARYLYILLEHSLHYTKVIQLLEQPVYAVCGWLLWNLEVISITHCIIC